MSALPLPRFMEVIGLSVGPADKTGAVVEMHLADDLMTPFGTVHGGFIAALFDTALAIAITRHLEPTDRVATHNLNVSYVAFSRDPRLVCRTRVVSLRRSVAIAEGEVSTAAGSLVAKAVGTFGIRRTAAP